MRVYICVCIVMSFLFQKVISGGARVPTFRPTAATRSPTIVPKNTSAPTTSNITSIPTTSVINVYFKIKMKLIGISYSTFIKDLANQITVEKVVANILGILQSEVDISFINPLIEDGTRRNLLASISTSPVPPTPAPVIDTSASGLMIVTVVTDGIRLGYNSQEACYNALLLKFRNAVESKEFDDLMLSLAEANGAVLLIGVTVVSKWGIDFMITTTMSVPTPGPTAQPSPLPPPPTFYPTKIEPGSDVFFMLLVCLASWVPGVTGLLYCKLYKRFSDAKVVAERAAIPEDHYSVAAPKKKDEKYKSVL